MQHILKGDEPDIICESLGMAAENYLNRFFLDFE
jgi:hypothetical protein